MKAQIVMEYIFVLTFLLVIIVPLMNYSFIKTSEKINEKKALDYVNTMSRNVNFLYSQGPGASRTFSVPAPGGINYENSFVRNKTIQISTGGKEYSRSVKSNITGNVPRHAGDNFIELEYLPSGYIIINNAKILAPSYFSTTLSPGQNYIETFNIKNIYDGELENIAISTEGPAFVVINPVSLSALSPGAEAEFEYRVNAPSQEGEYTGRINIKENDRLMRVIPFAVHVYS